MNVQQILLFEKSKNVFVTCVALVKYKFQRYKPKKKTTISSLWYKSEHLLKVFWKCCFIKPKPQMTFNFFTFSGHRFFTSLLFNANQ